VIATPKGVIPTGTMAVTMFVVVSITEILLLRLFGTYAFFPSGLMAMSQGLSPTGTVAVTLFVAASITETLLLPA
jgi:hypothetical protein